MNGKKNHLFMIFLIVQLLLTVQIFASGSSDHWYNHGGPADLDLGGDGHFRISGSGTGTQGRSIFFPLAHKNVQNEDHAVYYDFPVLASWSGHVGSGGRILLFAYYWTGSKFKNTSYNAQSAGFVIPAYYTFRLYIDAYDESSDDDRARDYSYSVNYHIDRRNPEAPDFFSAPDEQTDGIVQSGDVSLVWLEAIDNNQPFGSSSLTIPASGIRYYTIKDQITDEILKDTIDPTPGENDLVSTTLSLEEGFHSLIVYATDKAGNVGANSEVLELKIDGTGPGMVGNVAITGLSELSDADYPYLPADNGELALSWNAAVDPEIASGVPGSGVTDYRVYMDGTEQTGFTIENYDDSYETSFTPEESLASGLHELSIVAVDNVGNEGTPAVMSFYVDASLPEAPTDFACTDGIELDGIYYTKPGTSELSVSWTGSELDGSSEIWESGFDSYAIQRLDPDGEWSDFATAVSSPASIPVVKEETVVRVVAYDRIGNSVATDSFPVRILPELTEVSVPTPCYFDIGEGYTLRWNTPETDPACLGISEYRVIVRSEDEATPAATDFDSVSGQYTTSLSLTDQPTAEHLVAYIQARSTVDSDEYPHRGESIVGFRLPPLVIDPPDGEEYVLADDEYWWRGVHEVHGTVVVPAGRILGIESESEIQVFGNAAIRIESDGKLETYGVSLGDISFGMGPGETTGPGSWQGIEVYGTAIVYGVSIQDADRGITVLEGGSVSLQTTRLNGNEAGLHVYRGEATVNACEIENSELYGIKEDELGGDDLVITNTLFSGNGYDYYESGYGLLSIEKLNEKTGNAGNVKE